MSRPILRAALAALALAGTATPARAVFHLMVIQEVYAGHPGRPGAHYVVLRMTFSGQNLVQGQRITTFFADGTPGPDFGVFTSNVSIGAAGSRILMATQEAVETFGIAADRVTTGRLPAPSGKVCFAGTIDCVAYGSFTGNNFGFGTPAVALEAGKALKRTQDSNNNAADFTLGAPSPTNNAGAFGGADRDADLVPDFSDCAPSDPSVWFAPPEVTGVRIPILGTLSLIVEWDSLAAIAGTSTVYDLMRGSVPALNAAGGYEGVTVCSARGVETTSVRDVNEDFGFYLVRARNGCGVGTYGSSNVSPDPRDFLDEPGTDPCSPTAAP